MTARPGSVSFPVGQYLRRIEKMAHLITEECVLCTLCAAVCPEGAVRRAGERYVIEATACTDCGTCVEVCPQECILAPEALSSRAATPP